MILSTSGGLVYHARAAITRFKSAISRIVLRRTNVADIDHRDAWAATRRSVSTCVRKWLNSVSPDTLIVFGPSAGYLLEPDVLSSVRVVAVDPDPIAKFLFKKRFSNTSVTWIRRADLLPFFSASPLAFKNFIASFAKDEHGRNRKVALLFFGVLGQVEFHSENFERSPVEARRLFQEATKHIPWASLHDLESTETKSPTRLQINPDSVPENLDTQQSRTKYFAAKIPSATTWIDHDTAWLGPPKKIIPWPLTKKKLQILGFQTSAP